MINRRIPRPIERLGEVHRLLLDGEAEGRANPVMVRSLISELRKCAALIESWLNQLERRPTLGALRRQEKRRDSA